MLMDQQLMKSKNKVFDFGNYLRDICLLLIVAYYITSTSNQILYDLIILLFGISFVLSSYAYTTNKKRFYTSLICGSVAIIASLTHMLFFLL